MLHPRPSLRPSVARIRAHPFFLPLSDEEDDDSDRGISCSSDSSSGISSIGNGAIRNVGSDAMTTDTIIPFPPRARAKGSKVIRLFGEAPLYDVYFSYRRSCPSDKVTSATFADHAICS